MAVYWYRFGEVCLKLASLVTMAAQASVWCIYFVCMVQLFGFALPRAISQGEFATTIVMILNLV